MTPSSIHCLLPICFLVTATLVTAEELSLGRTAPPLQVRDERVVQVDSARQLREAAENAVDGTTILVADGDYQLDRLIYLRAKKNVAIRGASGDPRKVTVRGKGWDSRDKQDDLLRIGDCQNITVADLTFADCHAYGIKVEAEHRPKNVTIYNCRFRDIGTRAIKGSGGRGSAEGGSIRYCHFENMKVPPTDWLYDGNYISAIDMMALDGWVISDNVFQNIKGRTGGGRAAIFVWVISKNVTVERNLIVDCDRGIAFGNPSQSSSAVENDEFHVQGGICRNNAIVAGPDAGIELWWVDNVHVLHNTIWRSSGRGRGIRIGARLRDVKIINNLVRGEIIQEQDPASAVRIEHNLTGLLADYFNNPLEGDLHLRPQAAKAIDSALPLRDVSDDFDAQPRGEKPDLGADEFVERE